MQPVLILASADTQPLGGLAKVGVVGYQNVTAMGTSRRYHRVRRGPWHYVPQARQLVPSRYKEVAYGIRNVLISEKTDDQTFHGLRSVA
jgi:hypothetical protein